MSYIEYFCIFRGVFSVMDIKRSTGLMSVVSMLVILMMAINFAIQLHMDRYVFAGMYLCIMFLNIFILGRNLKRF